MPETVDLGEMQLPLLVFGGPYSNLAASRAMRTTADQLGIPAHRVICTGDLVAYCAEARETVECIRDWGIHVVMGNCEESLADNRSDCGCGFEPDSSCSLLSVGWYQHASREVTEEQCRWMASLPRQLNFTAGGLRFTVIHGSHDSINEFVFASTDSARKSHQLRASGADCLIGGHSGIPFGEKLSHGSWLNSGVIGMPANDGSPDGWYLLLQGGEQVTGSWFRLSYDHRQSARSTIAAGMVEYGQALSSGFWPSMDVLPAAERQQQGRRLIPEPITL